MRDFLHDVTEQRNQDEKATKAAPRGLCTSGTWIEVGAVEDAARGLPPTTLWGGRTPSLRSGSLAQLRCCNVTEGACPKRSR